MKSTVSREKENYYIDLGGEKVNVQFAKYPQIEDGESVRVDIKNGWILNDNPSWGLFVNTWERA